MSRLFYKFYFSICITIIVTVMIMGSIVLSSQHGKDEAYMFAVLKDDNTAMLDYANQLFEDYMKLSELLSNAEFVESSRMAYSEATVRTLGQIKDLYPMLKNVLIHWNGIVYNDTNSVRRDNPIDIKDNGYYYDFLENRSLTHYVREPFQAPHDGESIITFVSQNHNSEDLTGIILALNMTGFIQNLEFNPNREIEKEIIFLDASGNVVADSVCGRVFDDQWNVRYTDPDVYEMLINEESGVCRTKFRNQDVMMAFQKVENMAIYAITLMDAEIMDQMQKDNFLAILNLTIMLLLVGSVVVFYITRKLTYPIKELTLYAEDVSLKKNINCLANIDQKILRRKDEIGALGNAINEMVSVIQYNYKELKENAREMLYTSEHDHLTDLKNRYYFNNHLDQMLFGGNSLSVIMMDIDDFKIINDTMGHVYGDKVHIEVSSALKRICPSNCDICRFGGDEFILYIRNLAFS